MKRAILILLSILPGILFAQNTDSSHQSPLMLSRIEKVGEVLELKGTDERIIKNKLSSLAGKVISEKESKVASSLTAILTIQEVSARSYATKVQIKIVYAHAKTSEEDFKDREIIEPGKIFFAQLNKEGKRIFLDEDQDEVEAHISGFLENFISIDEGRTHHDLFGPPPGTNLAKSWQGNTEKCTAMLSSFAQKFPNGMDIRSRLLDTKKIDGIVYASVMSQIVAHDFQITGGEIESIPHHANIMVRTGLRCPFTQNPKGIWAASTFIQMDIDLEVPGETGEANKLRQTTQISQQSKLTPTF